MQTFEVVGGFGVQVRRERKLSLFEGEADSGEQGKPEHHENIPDAVSCLFGCSVGDGGVLSWMGLCLAAMLMGAHAEEPLSSADTLDLRALELYGEGYYAEAEALARESLALRLESPEEPPLEVATSLNNLAIFRYAQGDPTSAIQLFDRSLAIYRAELPERDPEIAQTLGNLALMSMALGDYTSARPRLQESLEIMLEVYGEGHPDVADSRHNLGGLMASQGDYAGARPLIEASLVARRAAYGEDHALVAESLGALGWVLEGIGDYAAARPLYERCLAIRRANLGDAHPDVATAMNYLAVLAHKLGDYETARPLFEQSLEISRSILGDAHPDVAVTLGNLSAVLYEQGDLVGALELRRQNLAILRATFGDQHPEVAGSQNSLAVMLEKNGDHAEAKTLIAESLEALRESVGEAHPDYALALHNLGGLMTLDGDHAEAQHLLEQSLQIRRASLGADHPDVANTLNALASVHKAQGDDERAAVMREQALSIVEGRLDLLDALSEREALRYVVTLRSALDRWLSEVHQPDQAWRHVLRVKGVVAARMRAAQARVAADPDTAAVAAELAPVRQSLARLALSSDTRDRASRLASLTADRDRLERDLLARSALLRSERAADDADPKTICAALPDGAALVDFFRYQRFGEPHYAAFAVSSRNCEVHRVELGPADPLDQAVLAWREVLSDPTAIATRVDSRGERVSTLLWAPLADMVGDARHLLVVPDGALAAAPIGALKHGGRYLLEDRGVTYLDRANDLLLPGPTTVPRGALVVGGVDYDGATTAPGVDRGPLAPCNDGGFTDLPGAAAESEALARRWRRTHEDEPLVFLGGLDATESAVGEALRGKAIAHLATHGFFASTRCRSLLTGDGTIGFDPMVLSGLALAGANRTADPLAREDGILTAAEVTALDLSGTSLVVLSACETGLGEMQGGQGVLGLRRAFASAGARTLIMTLWSVTDDDTAELMDEVYRLFLRRRSLPPAEALRRAQLHILEGQRSRDDERPGTWAAFISAGDWQL